MTQANAIWIDTRRPKKPRAWHRKELATIHADPHQVTSLAFSPGGRTLATAGWKKTAKLWDLTSVLATFQNEQ